jgi:hypothetical protein
MFFTTSPNDTLRLPKTDLKIAPDNSVKGPEFSTIGGLSAARFAELLDLVLEHNVKVDANCSFHINMSFKGMSLRGHDPMFQQAAIEYILTSNYPSCIKQRLNNAEWLNKYAKVNVNRDKYSMVAWRGSRWEFRLWGNINNRKDALECLLISALAFQHAWRVRLGRAELATPLMKQEPDVNFAWA